jgi:hypothetical protein
MCTELQGLVAAKMILESQLSISASTMIKYVYLPHFELKTVVVESKTKMSTCALVQSFGCFNESRDEKTFVSFCFKSNTKAESA